MVVFCQCASFIFNIHFKYNFNIADYLRQLDAYTVLKHFNNNV